MRKKRRWGNKLVLVGSQTLRESVLLPPSCTPNLQIGIQQYCMLERIGRARFNGEVTSGKHSICDPNEPQNSFHLRLVCGCVIFENEFILFFFSRKALLQLGLLAKQFYFEKNSSKSNNSCAGLLLHLPRFYCVFKPKHMMMTEQVVELLKARPNCVAEYTVLKEHFGANDYMALRKLFKQGTFHQFVQTDLVSFLVASIFFI